MFFAICTKISTGVQKIKVSHILHIFQEYLLLLWFKGPNKGIPFVSLKSIQELLLVNTAVLQTCCL